MTGRTAGLLAWPTDSVAQVAAQRKLIGERGVVVYLNHRSSGHPRSWETVRQVEKILSIRVERQFKDGSILVPNNAPSTPPRDTDAVRPATTQPHSGT